MYKAYSKEIDIGDISTLEEIDEDLTSRIVSNLSTTKKIILRLQGSVEIGRFLMYGWKGKLPFYLFKCDEHGYQIAYPSGHYLTLHCPKCLKKETRIRMILHDEIPEIMEDPIIVEA